MKFRESSKTTYLKKVAKGTSRNKHSLRVDNMKMLGNDSNYSNTNINKEPLLDKKDNNIAKSNDFELDIDIENCPF